MHRSSHISEASTVEDLVKLTDSELVDIVKRGEDNYRYRELAIEALRLLKLRNEDLRKQIQVSLAQIQN